jgi:hypothetical protein
MELELSTEGERKVFDRFEKDVLKYMNGEMEGIQLRQETAACAVFAKKIQSRSAMAMVKYDQMKKGLYIEQK